MVEYSIIRSNRKTISLKVTPGGQLEVRCPRNMPTRQVRQFVLSKQDWIEAALSKLYQRPALPAFTDQDLKAMTAHAKAIIPPRVAYFADRIGVTYGTITIRHQRSRWGSCTAKGNLNFNCLLTQMPPEMLDYIIVHELCHRKEMNHSPRFWAEVSKYMPDWESRRAWLKKEGPALIARLPK